MAVETLLRSQLATAQPWQLLARWRWWIAIGCGLLGYLFEQLEHQLEVNIDSLEILAYSLLLPITIWLILTLLARTLAEQAGVVASHVRHQRVAEQLDAHHGWDELTRYVVHLPAELLPIQRARLYRYDHRAALFDLVADTDEASQPPNPAHAQCKACVRTHLPHFRSDLKEYCQPLVYDNLLIGVLRLQFQPEALVDQQQLHFLSSVAPQIALAMAMAIAQPQTLTQAEDQARSEERRQLAHELHDSLAQHLGYLHLGLDRLILENSHLTEDSWRQELTLLREVAGDAYLQVRDQLSVLRHQEGGDLVEALRNYSRLVARRSRVRISFGMYGEPMQLSPALHAVVFGLVREGLNNVQRHAHAYEAQVVLFWGDDQLIVTVTDDGQGFKPAERGNADHHGLTMISERLRGVNGRLRIHSTPGRGTRLICYLPLDRHANDRHPALERQGKAVSSAEVGRMPIME